MNPTTEVLDAIRARMANASVTDIVAHGDILSSLVDVVQVLSDRVEKIEAAQRAQGARP